MSKNFGLLKIAQFKCIYLPSVNLFVVEYLTENTIIVINFGFILSGKVKSFFPDIDCVTGFL